MSEKQKSGEAAEAAAIRRRWITLGEVLAVAAVAISGLTLWNSYQERSSAEAERAAEKQERSAKAQTLVLQASGSGEKLELKALDPNQAIQGQTIAFPAALGRKPIDTVDPRIEAGWIEAAARAASKADRSRSTTGDLRLPVAITTRFVSDGVTHSDTAIYDVGYRLDEDLFDTDAQLLGLSLVERVPAARAQAKLDAVWNRAKPR